MEIHDPNEWRLSKSGFSIRAGWSNEKRIIARYPGRVSPLDKRQYQQWLDDAQHIVDLHNSQLNGDTNAS